MSVLIAAESSSVPAAATSLQSGLTKLLRLWGFDIHPPKTIGAKLTNSLKIMINRKKGEMTCCLVVQRTFV